MTTALPHRYRDAESFLRAVALGDEAATLAQRIRAAGMLLRAGEPASSSGLPPRARQRLAATQAQAEADKAWEAKANIIRAEFGDK